MKLLYTAPRFHTNQAPIVKGLVEKGHEVRYFVVFVGATEDHTYCEPLVLKPSKTTIRQKKKLSKTKTESEIESIIGGRFIPDYAFLKKAFEDYMPDVVICRERTNLTLCVKSLCDKHSIPCILYDQEPLCREKLPAQPKPAASRKNNSLIKRVRIKAGRLLNSEQRALTEMRDSSGFPKVRMTPVKYILSGNEQGAAAEHDYYIPLIYHAEKSVDVRPYFQNGIVNILCVGKFREYKNLPLLIEAASRIKDIDGWRLTLAGQAVNRSEKEYCRAISKKIDSMGLNGKIEVLTNLDYSEMYKLYLSNDLLIMPSLKETYGMAITESMAYGQCVIASDTCGAAFSVFEAGGEIFSSNDAEGLTNILKRLIVNRTLIEEKGKSAAEYIMKNQSFEQYRTALNRLLKEEFDTQLDY